MCGSGLAKSVSPLHGLRFEIPLRFGVGRTGWWHAVAGTVGKVHPREREQDRLREPDRLRQSECQTAREGTGGYKGREDTRSESGALA